MNITVVYSAQAQDAAGTVRETIPVESASLERLLLDLCQRHGEALKKLLLDAQGRIHPSVLLAVDDEVVPSPAGFSLRDQQTVTILPPIAGG